MVSVAQSPPSDRALFIRQTYTHLAGAVAAFIVVEFILFQLGIAEALYGLVAGSRFAWMAILGGFSLLGWMSRGLVSKNDAVEKQYMGLGLYIIGEALIFAPLLYIAQTAAPDGNVIQTAAILTLLLFAGLTTVAFTTRKDFSFLGSVLRVGGFIALGLIVCSLIFGFSLGLLFSVVMVVFASAAILYSTSKVIHNYAPHQYVAASLELFSSVALLFYYIVRIVLRSRN